MDQWVESTVTADLSPTSSLGVTLSTETPPKITKLAASSVFLGKLFIGDAIFTVNDETVKTPIDFTNFCRKSSKVRIKLKRDEYCSVKITALPPPRPGTESFEFDLKWRSGGVPIGILVYQDMEKRTIISIVESGTLAAQSLRPGDILTKVNGTPIPDKHMAKKLIGESVKAKHVVKLTVERPKEVATSTPNNGNIAKSVKAPTTTVAASSANSPSSVSISSTSTSASISTSAATTVRPGAAFDLSLPADVLAILDANRHFYKIPIKNPPIIRNAPITQQVPIATSGSHLSLPQDGSQPEEQNIEFDPSQKPLRPTPKRVGAA